MIIVRDPEPEAPSIAMRRPAAWNMIVLGRAPLAILDPRVKDTLQGRDNDDLEEPCGSF